MEIRRRRDQLPENCGDKVLDGAAEVRRYSLQDRHAGLQMTPRLERAGAKDAECGCSWKGWLFWRGTTPIMEEEGGLGSCSSADVGWRVREAGLVGEKPLPQWKSEPC